MNQLSFITNILVNKGLVRLTILHKLCHVAPNIPSALASITINTTGVFQPAHLKAQQFVIEIATGMKTRLRSSYMHSRNQVGAGIRTLQNIYTSKR